MNWGTPSGGATWGVHSMGDGHLMSLRKRYVLATIGKESGAVHRISFLRFRTRRKAIWWKDRLNSKLEANTPIHWVVMELGHAKG